MTEATVNIRRAVVSDAHLLWNWRNDPDVRAASLNSEPIPFENHRGWLEAVLADQSREILIAEQEGRPVGMVRFDVEENTATVHILLDPIARGHGLSKQILNNAISSFSIPFSQLRATVKAENTASLKLFRSLGFDSAKAGDVFEFECQRSDLH
ncbi:MAG: GNAT family N-acetyltransferase [Boseongicola sp.]